MQSISEQFVDGIVKETLINIDNIFIKNLTKGMKNTTVQLGNRREMEREMVVYIVYIYSVYNKYII